MHYPVLLINLFYQPHQLLDPSPLYPGDVLDSLIMTILIKFFAQTSRGSGQAAQVFDFWAELHHWLHLLLPDLVKESLDFSNHPETMGYHMESLDSQEHQTFLG